jgi:hypothetical protein
METNVQPHQYYLIKHQYYLINKPRGAFAILAATDGEIQELYHEGVRGHGVPFKTRAEAQAAVEALKSDLTVRSRSGR